MRWSVPISSPTTRRPHSPSRPASCGSESMPGTSASAAKRAERSSTRAPPSPLRSGSDRPAASVRQKSASSPSARWVLSSRSAQSSGRSRWSKSPSAPMKGSAAAAASAPAAPASAPSPSRAATRSALIRSISPHSAMDGALSASLA